MERIQQMKWQRKFGISRTSADVLMIVIDFMNASKNNDKKDYYGQYYVYASRKTIAREIGKSVATVNRAIAELVKKGILIVKKGIRNSRTYFTDKMREALGLIKNDISQDVKMISRIKGISKITNMSNSLSICKQENAPLTSDDYVALQRNAGNQNLRQQKKKEKIEKESKYRRLLQRLLEQFNTKNEMDADNYFTLKHFAEVIATKIVYSTSVRVFNREVSTNELYEKVQYCDSATLLEAAALTEKQQMKTNAIKNRDAYTIAILFNML